MSTVEPREPVVVVGAGPVGCTAALIMADQGVRVVLLERYLQPHPLPRAVHLDDEVVRVLHRVGVSEDFLARSRPATGLRLVDGQRRVMAEFGRPTTLSPNGFPYANMFDQPELEQLLLARVERHPLITFRRGIEIAEVEFEGTGAFETAHVRGRDVGSGQPVAFSARYVLGCDGANSTVREQLGVSLDDLRFTERWLVVDVRAAADLDPWGGVEQVCDPRRSATFMRVVDDRYRWEFQLRDDEQEADLVRPDALGRLLQPWTGRTDLDGLEVVRTATYTFRARLARRFRVGPVFLLGDAAHLTPPFIGQGLGAGLRDAANLAWKVAAVLDDRATPDLLDTYDSERRPHARALVKKAVMAGWAMSGGQDRAAGVRRLALALAVRSGRVRDAIACPVTPPLLRGALDRSSRLRWRWRSPLRVGALVPNVLVRAARSDDPQRLDDVLAGRVAAVTGPRPSAALSQACREKGLLLVALNRQGTPPPGSSERIDAVVVGSPGALGAVLCDPELLVVVRPDAVVAAVQRGQNPAVPWGQRRPTRAVAGGMVTA